MNLFVLGLAAIGVFLLAFGIAWCLCRAAVLGDEDMWADRDCTIEESQRQERDGR